jgi:hypothetical protein
MKTNGLALPFKPFTPDEICEMTSVHPTVLDAWMKDVLKPCLGDDGFTRGLNYMQTFAVFVGTRWLQEGAGAERVIPVVAMISGMTEGTLETECVAGRTWPVPATSDNQLPVGICVKPPANSTPARRLNLYVLHKEFLDRVERKFGDVTRVENKR